uniref:Uncharacterized protein n=1 Tax=Rhizophora mucronata TaxID=61149 RepID=A0A2P2M8A9_RHIMU
MITVDIVKNSKCNNRSVR